MASFFCHVAGVAMQFRLERNVRAPSLLASKIHCPHVNRLGASLVRQEIKRPIDVDNLVVICAPARSAVPSGTQNILRSVELRGRQDAITENSINLLFGRLLANKRHIDGFGLLSLGSTELNLRF